MALNDIPFYGAYIQRKAQNEAQPTLQLQQMAQVGGLLNQINEQHRQAGLEAAMRALPADATPEQRMAAAMPFVRKPETILNTAATQANTQAQIDARTQAAQDALAQRKDAADQMHEFRMGQIANVQDANIRQSLAAAETSRHNKAMEGLQVEANRIRGSQASVKTYPIVNTTSGIFERRPEGLVPLSDASGKPLMPANTLKSALDQQKAEEGKKNLTDLIGTLDNAYEQLHKAGAIADTNASPLSNAANYVASSGVGQLAGRIAGTQAQQYRDTINTIRPSIINAIKQRTGMGATQLNSNVELQFYLQSATDPSKSYQVNKAAIAILDKQYGLGLGINADAGTMAALQARAPKATAQPGAAPAQGWSIKPIP